MIDNYIDLKTNYKNYLIIIKSGVFYTCINDDAFILNKLDKLKINYIVYDNSIISKVKFSNNNYNKYKIDINSYNNYFRRIKNISNILEDKINSKDLKDILKKIENILCTII